LPVGAPVLSPPPNGLAPVVEPPDRVLEGGFGSFGDRLDGIELGAQGITEVDYLLLVRAHRGWDLARESVPKCRWDAMPVPTFGSKHAFVRGWSGDDCQRVEPHAAQQGIVDDPHLTANPFIVNTSARGSSVTGGRA